MKKNLFHLLFTTFLVLMLSTAFYAQEPPPPPGDPSGNGGNPPVGGGVPVGEGIVLLVAMATGYGYRVYKIRSNKEKGN